MAVVATPFHLQGEGNTGFRFSLSFVPTTRKQAPRSFDSSLNRRGVAG